ncbi:MAG: HDOD domain-containing protein [Candidatus Thiodiazotropha sp.]|nr:HDOD domain-containing protein [Candidatus Thiodiazotropha sp.]
MNDIAFQFIQDLSNELSSGELKLPAFPDIAVRVKKALEEESVSAEKVAKVIGSDPVLSARLLKVANSNFSNRSGANIKDLRTAIARLGYDLAYNTAVSIAIEQIFHSSSVSDRIKDHLEELWHHSLHVSAIAYTIAKKLTSIKPDEAMLAGLLHDIGKFYILTRSEQHPELFNDRIAMEELLKNWHTGIGQAILETWTFSEEMATAANEHDDLERPHAGPPDITDVVTTANLCAHWEQLGDDFDWSQVTAAKRLKLTEATTKEILEESADEIQSILHALGK